MNRPRQTTAGRATVLAPAIALAFAAPLPAQDAAGDRPNAPVELVDRVAAVVGDTVVLYTEILESLLQAQAAGEQIPPAGTAAFDSLADATLRQLVDQMVLLQRAQQEDISVSEDAVEAETDRRFREVRGSFPSASAFEQAITESGRTLVQYRLFLRSQVEAQMIIQQFIRQMQGSLPPVNVSEEEARAWFDENLAGRPQPPTITFEQVVIRPSPDEDAETIARDRAIEALEAVRGGLDFEVAARQYSEDPTNRDDGGDLGWVRRAEIDSDFARAAWAARTGTPIGPIRTQFGYHVIKVENVRGGERKIRHILVSPTIDQDDVERARALATAVADSARDGVSIEHLARHHGLAEEPVRIPNVPIDRLGEGGYGDYVAQLQSPIPGEIVGPFDTRVRGLRFVVLKVIDFTPRGTLAYEDARQEIRRIVTEEKALARLVEELRTEVFVDVRI